MADDFKRSNSEVEFKIQFEDILGQWGQKRGFARGFTASAQEINNHLLRLKRERKGLKREQPKKRSESFPVSDLQADLKMAIGRALNRLKTYGNGAIYLTPDQNQLILSNRNELHIDNPLYQLKPLVRFITPSRPSSIEESPSYGDYPYDYSEFSGREPFHGFVDILYIYPNGVRAYEKTPNDVRISVAKMIKSGDGKTALQPFSLEWESNWKDFKNLFKK